MKKRTLFRIIVLIIVSGLVFGCGTSAKKLTTVAKPEAKAVEPVAAKPASVSAIEKVKPDKKASALSFPKADENDVLVPQRVISAIPGFDAKQPVYAACDINGWFVRGETWATENNKKGTQMIQEGGNWRAPGLAGQRFHPVQLDKEGQPKWAKIENVYPLNSKFIDTSGPGPCFKVE